MTRSALVTGATGFIGGRLAARLVASGRQVMALVRSSSNLAGIPAGVTVRVADDAAGMATVFAEAKPDIVFHLAALYLADHRPDQIADLIAANVLLTAHLAEALSAGGNGRLIATSTASTLDADGDYAPASLYAATKRAGTDLLAYFHQARGLSVATIDLFDTYGPADPRRKLVQLLVDAAVSAAPIGLSPGEQLIDLLHVDDAADAHIAAAERLLSAPAPVWEQWRVGGERQSIRALASEVERALGRPVLARWGERPYRAREIMVPAAATGLPGWSPARRLADGLRELAQ